MFCFLMELRWIFIFHVAGCLFFECFVSIFHYVNNFRFPLKPFSLQAEKKPVKFVYELWFTRFEYRNETIRCDFEIWTACGLSLRSIFLTLHCAAYVSFDIKYLFYFFHKRRNSQFLGTSKSLSKLKPDIFR